MFVTLNRMQAPQRQDGEQFTIHKRFHFALELPI